MSCYISFDADYEYEGSSEKWPEYPAAKSGFCSKKWRQISSLFNSINNTTCLTWVKLWLIILEFDLPMEDKLNGRLPFNLLDIFEQCRVR